MTWKTWIRGASATAIYNNGQVHAPATEDSTDGNEHYVRSALEYPVCMGVLLAMPASDSEVLLGTLDR